MARATNARCNIGFPLVPGKEAAMFRSAFAVAILSVAALSAGAQTADEAAVQKAMDAFARASIAGDKAALEALTAPEITYGHSDGRVQDRATFIEPLATRKSTFKTMDFTKQTISIAGDTAIVRNHLAADVDPGARHVELEMIFVWQKRNGEWKLLLRQASKI
jgi:ketosteroid isomerase-like protein